MPHPHHNDKAGTGEKSFERHQSNPERKAVNKERAEAGKELDNGALNKDISANALEQRKSRKSQATKYGVPSADSLLPLKKSKTLPSSETKDSDSEPSALAKQSNLKEDSSKKHPQEQTAEKARKTETNRPYSEKEKSADSKGSEAGSPVGERTINERRRDYQMTHPEFAPLEIPKIDAAKHIEHTAKAAYRLEDTAIQNTWSVVDKAMVEAALSKPETWTNINLSACKDAVERFPSLRSYGVDETVIAGIILNETVHREQSDVREDGQVERTGKVIDANGSENDQASIGPAQMQIRNIRDLSNKYQQLTEFRDDPCRAALNPDKAPYFVAAYLQDKIQAFDKHDKTHPNEPIPKCYESLLYTYNPDVVSKHSGSDEFRAISAQEKLIAAIIHKSTGTAERSPTLHGWKSEFMPRNLNILHASEVVKDIKHSINAISKHDFSTDKESQQNKEPVHEKSREEKQQEIYPTNYAAQLKNILKGKKVNPRTGKEIKD